MINVILCGGSGSRLWPLSRELKPKQFINLFGQHSLLQKTAAGNRLYCTDTIIVCNTDHHFLSQQQLATVDVKPSLYILEPAPKNTAAAICFAMLAMDPEEIVLITPADHLIDYSTAYAEALKRAEVFAAAGEIAIFGISPTHPETGYGYIEANQDQVTCFHEKPNLETAMRYLSQGHFFWNSGMICARARVMLDAIRKSAPDIYEAAEAAFLSASFKTDSDRVCKISVDAMHKIPSESIDYAVLERSKNLKFIAGKFSWSDVGSFDSLFSQLPKDEQGNALASGDFSSLGANNNLVIGANRMISLIDVENLVVVDTEDALLISKLGSSQKVKEMVSILKDRGMTLHRTHVEESRPWGSFTVIEEGEYYKVKRILVHPGKRLSLQKHHHRSEHWVVVSGQALATVGNQQQLLHPNQSIFIPREEIHRVQNSGDCDLIIVEVQFGAYLGEDDIVRIEDDFSRLPEILTV